MDCINYINDLTIEIETLDLIRQNCDDVEEKNKLNLKIKEKEDLVYRCKNNLSKLSDDNICCRIYVHMLNGLSPSKAVEKVAEENYIRGVKPTSVGRVWDNYYKKLKKIIKQ